MIMHFAQINTLLLPAKTIILIHSTNILHRRIPQMSGSKANLLKGLLGTLPTSRQAAKS